ISRHLSSILFPYTTLFRSQTSAAPRLVEGGNLRLPPPLRQPFFFGCRLFVSLFRLPGSCLESSGSPRFCRTTLGFGSRRREADRSEEHTSELQSLAYLVCR